MKIKILIFFLIFIAYFVYSCEHADNGDIELKTSNLSLKSPKITITNKLPYNNDKPIKKTIKAIVTAYNTVPGQTDDSPCIGASGYQCGRSDVVACPRSLPLGTHIIINTRSFYCLDRTALKHDGRFDISFDKDIQAAWNWGIQELLIKIL